VQARVAIKKYKFNRRSVPAPAGAAAVANWRGGRAGDQGKESVYFDIARQPADQALVEFAEQAGETFLFPVDKASKVTANAVRGRFTPQQAIDRLLDGTGLKPRFDVDGILNVSVEGEASERRVADRSPEVPAAPLIGGEAVNGASNAGSTSRGRLEEILVSARKQEENLQDVPIAVTVLSGEELKRSQIRDLTQLAGRVPGLTIQSLSTLESEVFIRGVGTVRLNGATADPSVGYFLDEIYIGRRGSATPPIFDLQRLEVLRGPQGTLFGKNVVGGAISVTTARPQTEFGGSAYLAVGNFDAIQSGGYITGPLNDSVSFRVALDQSKHDGYAKNVVRDEAMEDQDSYAARASLAWKIAADKSLFFTVDTSTERGNGLSRHAVDNPHVPGFGPVTPNLASSNPRTNESPFDQYANKDTNGITLRFEWDLGSVDATYLASLRTGEGGVRWTQAGTDSPPSLTSSTLTEWEENTGLTQELRIASERDRRRRWLVGLYYLDDHTDRTMRNTATSFLLGGAGSPRDILDGDNEFIQTGVSRNYAIFGEASIDFRDNLTFSIGGRYTQDRKEWDVKAVEYSFGPSPSILSAAPLRGPYSVSETKTWDELTPKAILDWKIDASRMLYLSVARGFKGGGWQGISANAFAASTAYAPETAWNYEVGVKSEMREGAVRLNVAGFYADFQDLQVELLDDVNLVLVIANAANAVIQGIEAEFQAKAHETTTLFASGSYIDAKYKNYVDPLQGIDYSDNRMQRTPEYQFNMGFDVRAPLRNDVEFLANVQYGYQSDMYFGPDNTNDESGYGLLDARAGIGSASGTWSLFAYARNMTGELYRVSVIPFAGDEFSAFGPPRTYGLRYSVSF
jgi:iron complex outermembrane recepter protein